MTDPGETDGGAPDLGGTAPVTIELGRQVVFGVEVVVRAMAADGLRVYLLPQSEWGGRDGSIRKRCRLFVHPDDASLARARLAIAGLL